MAILLLGSLLLLPSLGKADTASDYIVIDFERFLSLVQQSQRDLTHPMISLRNAATSAWGGSIKYLIIPRQAFLYKKESEQKPSWAVVNLKKGLQYLKRITPPFGIIDAIENGMQTQNLANLADDVVVLDDVDLRRLTMLVWFNRDSYSDSEEARAIDEFRREFLDNLSRRWFLELNGNRLVIVTGLSGESKAIVNVYLRGQEDPTPSFQANFSKAKLLKDAIRLLHAQMVPITVSLKVEAVGDARTETDDILRCLEVSLTKGEQSSQRLYIVNKREDRISLTGVFQRDVLDSDSVSFSLNSCPYSFLDREKGLRQSLAIPLPKVENMLQEGALAPFSISIAKVRNARNLTSEGVWRHSLSMAGISFPKEIGDILQRHRDLAARFSVEDNSCNQLYTDPGSYLDRIGSRMGQAVLGLAPQDQRQFAIQLEETNSALEALWDRIEVDRWLAKGAVEVLLICQEENLPLFSDSQARKRCSYAEHFLKFRAKGSRYSEEDIQIMEIVRKVSDSDVFGKIEVGVIPIPLGGQAATAASFKKE